MAQLRDTVVSGSLRATDSLLTTTLQAKILNIPTATNGTTYGPGTSGHIIFSNGSSSYWGATTGITSLGTVTTGTWSATTIAVNKGGTGNTSWTQWGVLYASASTTLTNTAAGTAGYLLQGNGSAAPSWIQATDSSTASTIVKRDASKNFSAGTITASLSGNATSATKANITSNQYGIAYFSDTAGTFATTSQGTSGYLLQGNGASAPSWIQATNSNTASTIVKRDASGNFSAGTITASLSGNATSANSATKATQDSDGNAINTTYLKLSGGMMTGSLRCNFGNDSARHFMNVAFYEFNGDSFTGTVKIKLPNTAANCVMMMLRILIFDYNANSGSELLVSGYTYSNGYWYNYAASTVGTFTKGVRLAYDGTNFCVLLGTTTSTWNYSKIILSDVYSGYTVQPETGYAISVITNESGYTITGGVSTHLRADKVYGAVWNDYAEYRASDELLPGTCVQEQDNGHLIAADQRLIPGASIISDTWGFSQGETETAKTPIAVSGRVLAIPYRPREEYHAGMAVCSAPNGTIDIMTRDEIRDYPDAIVGIVSEIPEYEEWGGGELADRDSVKVNGRIWIKVK